MSSRKGSKAQRRSGVSMNRTNARALRSTLAAMAGVPLLHTGKGASSNLQNERSCLEGGAPNAKNFIPVPMSAKKCHQHGASQEAERSRALRGGVLQPTGAGSWHRPRFWRQTRRSEEFIHHRGKCSRASEPLAVDLRPVGAANWPARGRPECRPYGASAARAYRLNSGRDQDSECCRFTPVYGCWTAPVILPLFAILSMGSTIASGGVDSLQLQLA